MPVLSLSIGSNINPSSNILKVLVLLRQEFGEISCSQIYESEAVGFVGENFINVVVTTYVTRPLAEISTRLKSMEDELGRDRQQPKFSGRTIDIDILTYGNESGANCGLSLPREEITRNAFVLLPLSEMLPDTVHPATGKSYAQLWQDYDKSSQKLWVTQLPGIV